MEYIHVRDYLELGKKGKWQGEIGCSHADRYLPHRPVGCRIGPARTTVSRSAYRSPATPLSTHDCEYAALCATHRLRLALAAGRLATLADRLLLPAKMA